MRFSNKEVTVQQADITLLVIDEGLLPDDLYFAQG